jgi:hypothetical protein
VNEITVARNRAADALAEVGRAVESLLNSFHGKVSVASVHNFKKRNLGIPREVHILLFQYSFLYCLTISYESLFKDPECHLVDELHPHFLEKSVSQKG